jgi:hypothetical protein
MKLGTETGSMVNHLYSRYAVTDIQVGQPATLLSWTDRYPATVVEVFKKGLYTYVVVQSDDYKRIDSNGMSEAQEYEYKRNPEGAMTTFKLVGGKLVSVRKNKTSGRYVRNHGAGCVIGVRERYYDFSF